jgi:transposase InsO family protein
VWQQLLNATPDGRQPRYGVYGVDFDARLGGLGIRGIRTPVLAPKANAVAERMVRTFRQECLDHLIVLNEEQLVRILSEFVAYYNQDRPHRSLNLGTPEARDRPKSGVLRCHPILGGLHHSYEWAA